MRRVDRLLRATAQAEARHFWFRGFRAFVVPLVRRATRDRPHARILDCGCGTGANVALLNREGVAFGFDLAETGLQIGHASGRRRLARASVTAVPFPTAHFDLVTSFDVIYSLDDRDERTALGEMFRVLKPGGFAIVNVAALESLRGDHSVLSHEVRRYTRDLLRRRLEAAGFAIERLTYTNVVLSVPLFVTRALQRRRGLRREEEAQQEISVPPAPLNALLSGVLWIESLWIERFDAPFGSSLLCLARKPD
jgi:SAM-dependent methyltransferase